MQKPKPLLQRLGGHRLSTKYGELQVNGFNFGDSQQVVLALSTLEFAKCDAHLLRIQYGCEYGTVFGSRDCDCGLQVEASLELIAASSGGTMLYFRDHEARGFGLSGKIRITELEKANNWSTIEAERALGLGGRRPDILWVVPAVLQEIGVVGPIMLIGTNLEKHDRLVNLGLDVRDVRPLRISMDDLTEFALLDVDRRAEQ